ncbi:MAG: ATP-binding protein [Patescibacteria group bacterium]
MDRFRKERLESTMKTVILGRWIIILGASATGVIQKLLGSSSINLSMENMTLLIVSAMIYNVIFLLYLAGRHERSVTGLKVMSVLQVLADQFIFTLVVYFTGGAESLSFVFYILPIMVSTVLFSASGILLLAFINVLLYVGLIAAEYVDVIPHLSRYNFDPGIYLNLGVTVSNSLLVITTVMLGAIFSSFISRLLIEREEELRSERDKVASILRSHSDGLIMIDQQHRVILANPMAEEMLGITQDEVLGRQILKKTYEEKYKKLYEVLLKKSGEGHRAGEEEESFEVTFLEPSPLVLRVVTIPVYGPHDHLMGEMKVLHDVTREKAIDRMKSEFISIAAHQLRTPLSAIKWVIKLLLDGDAGKLKDEQSELLNKGYESNERMIRLVNDLLDVSRIEEGRFQFKFAVQGLEDFLSNVVQDFKPQIKERNISFALQLPQKALPKVRIDESKLRLAISNLIDNAIRYTPQKGRVVVKASYDAAKEQIAVTVEDSGVGIPKDQMEKLFIKFFRADNVIRMQTEGSGLGLFIVKNIVEKHGGKVTIASEEKVGTTATMTLPIEQKFKPEKDTEFEEFMESF